MPYAYILKSLQNNKYYVGSTENIERRSKEHNSGKVISTKVDRPWTIYYFEEFKDNRDAIIRERQIKSWKSRKMMEKLKYK